MSRGFFDQHSNWIPQADSTPADGSRSDNGLWCPFCGAEMADEGTELVCQGCSIGAPVEEARR